MIRENATRSAVEVGAPPAEPIKIAFAAVAERTAALRSAIAKVAFADAARLRDDLEHALSRAEALAGRLPERMARAAALHRLGALRGTACDLLQIAPQPSAAAIATKEAGDPALWDREEQAWIADRLAWGSTPRMPILRRVRRMRRDTRPESPWALRIASAAPRDAEASKSTLAASSPPPTSSEGGDR